jgi:hypothetical protein
MTGTSSASLRGPDVECLAVLDLSRQLHAEIWLRSLETIEAFCKDVTKKLPDHELELLWLDSATYFDHDDDHGPAARDELIAGVAQEIYGKVLEMANDEELKFDPDEEHQPSTE